MRTANCQKLIEQHAVITKYRNNELKAVHDEYCSAQLKRDKDEQQCLEDLKVANQSIIDLRAELKRAQ
jgi:hypothetical protein